MIQISYADAIKEPLISPEVEAEAIRRFQTEQHIPSLEILLRSHARISWAMAKQYANNPAHIEDLAAEGMIGLLKAAEKFKSCKGTRFATYSKWWVMTCITQLLPKVSTQLTMSPRVLLDARMGRLEGPDKDKAHAAVYGSIELDAPIADDDGVTAINRLECPSMNPEEEAETKSERDFQKQILDECLAELTPREQQVIYRRKLAQKTETLEEISKDINVTRERVRQIESRAMARLKKSLTARGFNVGMLRQ